MKRMKATPTLMLASFLIATLCLSACSNDQNVPDTASPTNPDSIRRPLPGSIRQAISLGDALDHRPTCPAFTPEESDELFRADAKVFHQGVGAEPARVIKCIVGMPNSEPDSWLKVDVFRIPYATDKTPQPNSPDPETTVRLFEDQYPGFGYRNKGFFLWACGPFRLSIELNSHSPFLPEIDPTTALQKVMESRVQELCGSLAKPAPELTSSPELSWTLFDAHGGTSPDKFGIPRPKPSST